MFRITEHIEFDQSGRATCPCCEQDGKAKNKNLSLVKGTDGAYKCHRGCTPTQIREALGDAKPQQIPAALAAPRAPVTITPQKVKEAHDQLLTKSTLALQWLNHRGFTPEMIQHYRLGIARSKVGDRTKPSGFSHLPSIAIPIPANAEGTSFYQKKRVAPWLPSEQRPDGYKKWSQYGIPNQTWLTYAPTEATATWLCEGEWDAMMLGWQVMQANLPIAVACFTCGCDNVPPSGELVKLPGEVVVFYDLDEAGEKGHRKVAEALGDRCRVAVVPAPTDAKSGWDVSDAFNQGFTLEQFLTAASEAIALDIQPQGTNPVKDRLITHDQLMARAADYTDWLVDDLLTSNELFLLAASPRAGKSLMAMTLAHAVASGGKFLGRPCSEGPVIYIRCEDSEAKTKERAIAQGWQEGLPIYWIDRFKLSELKYLKELVEEINPRLVIWDTLSRIRADSVSESSAEMSHVLEPLQDLCQDFNCTGLLVHHTGKVNVDNAGTIDIYDTIRGSSAIRGVCRGVLILAAAENKYRLCVENGWGKHDLDVLLDANTLTWRLLGNWVAPNVDLSQKDRVVEFLTQVGSASIEQIAEATNLPKRSLYEVLKRLQSDDVVTKMGQRQNSVYARRSIQQIQQLNSLLNCSNPDTELNTSSIQQKNMQGTSSGKVIIEGKSDQKMITFKDPPPKGNVVELGKENTENPCCDSDSAIQHNSTRIQHDLAITASNVVTESNTANSSQFNKLSTTQFNSSVNSSKVITTGTCDSSESGEAEPIQPKITPFNCTLEPGDKVEILSGQLVGKPAFVVQLLRRGRVRVRGAEWLVSQTYERTELKLLMRGGRSDG